MRRNLFVLTKSCRTTVVQEVATGNIDKFLVYRVIILHNVDRPELRKLKKDVNLLRDCDECLVSASNASKLQYISVKVRVCCLVL